MSQQPNGATTTPSTSQNPTAHSTPPPSQPPTIATTSNPQPETHSRSQDPSTAKSQSPKPSDQPARPNPEHAPSTSLLDAGTTPRPRDARTLHLLLASLGVSAYQDRVPLQLLDYAYRYTSSVLSDAQHLVLEGYVPNTSGSTKARAEKEGTVGLQAVRLAAAAARPGVGGSGVLSKESMLEIAQERNKGRLPDVDREGLRFGVRLPHERFVLTGVGWGIGEDGEDIEGGDGGDVDMGGTEGADGGMGGMNEANGGRDEDEEMGGEGGNDGFDQIFGNGEGDGEAGSADPGGRD